MYSEDDINSAVAAGAMSAEAAAGFRDYMSRVRELPRGSEENFRLINSFNDIFVAIGVVILLVAVGAIGQALAALIVPAPDYFTFYNSVTEPSDAQIAAWKSAHDLQQGLQTCLAGLFVAAAAWPLSEFFTRRRRMALPSILLLLAFVGGSFFRRSGRGTDAWHKRQFAGQCAYDLRFSAGRRRRGLASLAQVHGADYRRGRIGCGGGHSAGADRGCNRT